MSKPDQQGDRRKASRFIPPDHTFAALGEEFSRVGKVKNISLSGLVFEYVIDMEFFDAPRRVDIFLSENSFHISNVPCRKVYDLAVLVTSIGGPRHRTLTAKRCGVQFGKLSKKQERELKGFIRTRSIGIA